MIALKPEIRRRMLSPMRLYERNFVRLEALLPALSGVETMVANLEPGFVVRLRKLDATPYTSTVLFECLMAVTEQHCWISDPQIRVRLYHDAQVAEVVGYQNHHRFAARYDYPNRFMFQRNEKMQLNVFLSEFIDFLVKRNACFVVDAESPHTR